MKAKTILIIITWFLFQKVAIAQDLIVLKSKDSLNCKILKENNNCLTFKLKDSYECIESLKKKIGEYEDEKNKTDQIISANKETINTLKKDLIKSKSDLEFNDLLISQTENINIKKVKEYVDSVLAKLKEKYNKYEMYNDVLQEENKLYETYSTKCSILESECNSIFFNSVEVYKDKIKDLKEKINCTKIRCRYKYFFAKNYYI